MYTIMQIGIGSAVLLLTSVCIFMIYRFHTYKPQKIGINPGERNLKYFQETYEGCRRAFFDQADRLSCLHEGVEIADIFVKSEADEDLTIDYFYIPARKEQKRLFILSSGLHGLEGYAGSAVQQMFLKEMLPEMDLAEMGVLVIHALNPYGFKYKRRVDKNNIDLNRNCKPDARQYDIQNDSYGELNSWLNSSRKVSLTKFEHFFYPFYAMKRIIKYSLPVLRQAVLQGQYQYEQGIYYGGRELVPSIRDVRELIERKASAYEMIFNIDLHTGYGENGTLHLFQAPLKDDTIKKRLEQIFDGYVIDWGDAKDFYNVTGDYLAYIGHFFPDKYYFPMAFEYGTLDTRSLFGSFRALHNVMAENQGFHHGYASLEDEKETREKFIEGFYPSSLEWRSKVIDDSRTVLKNALKNYNKISFSE